MIVGDRDLLDHDLEITPGLNLTDGVVTFSDRHTELSGAVQTSSGQSVLGYVMIFFSTDPQSWRAITRRTQAVRPDSLGRFLVRDLPAGEYFAALASDIDPDELMTSAFFERLAPRAIRVTLGEGEHRNQDLQIAP